VVAIQHRGETIINPDPAYAIGKDDELILIGTYDAEISFLSKFLA
jgi:K+/H+ antiporter YhaU regulatory subunit KhtT